MSYWKDVRPTYIENWPSAMCRLSIAQKGVKMSVDDALRLGRNIIELFELFPSGPRDIQDLTARVDEAVKTFPSGAFVRLGSRSPKDSWLGHKNGFCVTTGQQAMKLLCDVSERVSEDLLLAISNNYEPWIWARHWQSKIRKDNEFRCFLKDRKLAGISQYNYFDGHLPWLSDNKDAIEFAIRQWLPAFIASTHLDNVIFDVFVYEKAIENTHEWQVKLLEINPFSEMTDPCLFDWRDTSSLDGRFLSVEKEKS